MSIKISVIIPAFNSEKTIEKAIESALSQSFPPSEIIVIDDCSSDKTFNLIERYVTSFPNVVKLLKNNFNRGAASARNTGIKESKYEWIAFLDADDFWHPKKLESQKSVVENFQANFVGTISSISIDAIISNNQILKILPNQLLWKNYFQTPTVLIKKNSHLLFDESFTHAEDFELWIRMINFYSEAFLIQEPLTFLGKEPFKTTGLSSQLWKMERGEIKALYKNYGLRSLIPILFSLMKYLRRVVISL